MHQDLSICHDWSVKKNNNCSTRPVIANQVKGKFEMHFHLFDESVGVQNKDLGPALQTLLTSVTIRLQCRLEIHENKGFECFLVSVQISTLFVTLSPRHTIFPLASE